MRIKDNKRKSEEQQKALLSELESIRFLLAHNSTLDDIPLLEERVTGESLVYFQEPSADNKEPSADNKTNNKRSSGKDKKTPGYHEKTLINHRDSLKHSASENQPVNDQPTANGNEPIHEALSKQQPLFKEAQQNERSSILKSRKPSLTNQSAEESVNPFLPEHIRKRLSSNPVTLPYKKSFIKPTRQNTPTEDQLAKIKWLNTNYQALIDSLVAEFMPLVEAKLRQKLIEKIAQIDFEKHK